MAELIETASISDVCFLVQDLERAITFYRDRVGFKLRRLAPGFADFFTAGVTLALWQVDHMQTNLRLPPGQARRGDGEPWRPSRWRAATGCRRCTRNSPAGVYRLSRNHKVSVECLCLLLHRPGGQLVGDLYMAGRRPCESNLQRGIGPPAITGRCASLVDDHPCIDLIQNGATQNGSHGSHR